MIDTTNPYESMRDFINALDSDDVGDVLACIVMAMSTHMTDEGFTHTLEIVRENDGDAIANAFEPILRALRELK